MTNNKVKIKAIHSHYVKSNVRGDNSDGVFVNQMVYHPDGTTEKRFKFVENPLRSWFYVGKANRGHKQRKLCYPKNQCDEYQCTQANLAADINYRVNGNRHYTKQRILNDDVNLFGTDVHVESVVRQKYEDKFGKIPYLPTTATMDYEWDIATGRISWGVLTYKRQVFLTVRADKVLGHPDYADEVARSYIENLQPDIDSVIHKANIKAAKKDIDNPAQYNIFELIAKMRELPAGKVKITERAVFEVIVKVVDRPVDVVLDLFNHAHRLQPDFLVLWYGGSSQQGGADLVRIQQAAEEGGVPLTDIFCDPRVPPQYRNVYIHHDDFIPQSTSGTTKPPHESNKLHRVEAAASFIVADLNFFFYSNRAHLPERASYSLDAILKTEIGVGKMKFAGRFDRYDLLTPKQWHETMAAKHPVEYGVYALQDGIGPLLLEEFNLEIAARGYPKLASARWANFKSTPKRLATKNHFAFLKKGLVIGCTGTDVTSPVHDRLIPSAGIIITLPSDSHMEMGTACCSDTPIDYMNFVQASSDSDLTSSYPKNQMASNASLPTTVIEILETEKYTREQFLELTLGFCAGNNSNLQFARATCGFPVLAEWERLYEEDKKNGRIK